MKTTIELPDDLLLLAKQRALEQGTTLRALIDKGLRHALSQAPDGSKVQQQFRFPVIRNALTATPGSPTDVNALIDAMREEGLGPFGSTGREP